jgi:indolepyruvate ferredoxin oxidoreductase beta subunit
MTVNTSSVSGYLRFHILATLRGLRPKTFRYRQEQRAIETWLRMIAHGAAVSAELAVEIAECARLIKGYGDTHKRGAANYRMIETELMLPALAGDISARQAAEAIANARTAALLDPEGEALAKCLADIQAQSSHRIATE